jgi:hypothetical protein
VAKQLGPNMVRTSLTPEQVRMILRIHRTDRYTRRAQGFERGTLGLREKLAKTFGVSPEVIKKITSLKHNQHGRPRRERFPGIALKSIERNVQHRLRRLGVLT